MKKGLFIYSLRSGKGKIKKYIPYILKTLSPLYDIETYEVKDLETLNTFIHSKPLDYDAIFFNGGDGFFNDMINILDDIKDVPPLGYIPSGTTCDMGKNLGLSKRIKISVNKIAKQKIVPLDVGRINNRLFGYVLAIGAYSDISYIAKQEVKSQIGSLAYYFIAIKQAFIPRKMNVKVYADNKEYAFESPFLMVLNSKRVGGFPVNINANLQDGAIDLFVTRRGLFNGLLHYLVPRKFNHYYSFKKIEIETDCNMNWCVDGEKGPKGKVTIEVVPSKYFFFVSPYKKKLKTKIK